MCNTTDAEIGRIDITNEMIERVNQARKESGKTWYKFIYGDDEQ